MKKIISNIKKSIQSIEDYQLRNPSLQIETINYLDGISKELHLNLLEIKYIKEEIKTDKANALKSK